MLAGVTDEDTLERTGDGSLTLRSGRFGQTFHSHHGAVTESRHVFLAGSGLLGRLESGLPSRLLEVGFGTGLNCWLAADAAEGAGTPLEMISLERSVLPAATLRLLDYGRHLDNPALLEAWLSCREAAPGVVPPGVLDCRLGEYSRLRVVIGEALAYEAEEDWADVVFLDAFSPDANSELWTEGFLGGLYRALRPGGVLVTYSVKGEVRRRLQGLGFSVSKLPGPAGGKREMLSALKPAAGEQQKNASSDALNG